MNGDEARENRDSKSFKIPGRRLSVGETTGLLVLALNIGAIIWGAATASASVQRLTEAVTELRASQLSQGRDVGLIQVDIGVLKADVSNLKGRNTRGGGTQ